MDQKSCHLCTFSIGCDFTTVQGTCTCCSLVTRERTQASTRRVHLIPYPSLVKCTSVPPAYSTPRCWLRPMLKRSDIVNSAPTRTIEGSETLNSAPSRTIQARNHIVRVPAIVRVFWFGTYPHYRGPSTEFRLALCGRRYATCGSRWCARSHCRR